MKAVIQRCLSAAVTVDGALVGKIDKGLLVLLGVGENDDERATDLMADKVAALRIFSDEEDKMNWSVRDIGGSVLAVSNFTLMADTKKGNRPSYIDAAPPAISVPLYEKFVTTLSQELHKEVQTGQFGADMKVELINDGPVTIIIDSKLRM